MTTPSHRRVVQLSRLASVLAGQSGDELTSQWERQYDCGKQNYTQRHLELAEKCFISALADAVSIADVHETRGWLELHQALAAAEGISDPLDIVNYTCRLAAASSHLRDYASAEASPHPLRSLIVGRFR